MPHSLLASVLNVSRIRATAIEILLLVASIIVLYLINRAYINYLLFSLHRLFTMYSARFVLMFHDPS